MNRKTVAIIFALMIALSVSLVYILVRNANLTPVHDVAISGVSVSTTQAYLGDTVNVTVVARNKGTVSETFNVTAYYDSTVIGTQILDALAPNAEKGLAFSWNTTGVSIANYVMKAWASSVPDEANTTDNTYIDDVVRVRAKPTGSESVFVDPPVITRAVGENFTVRINASDVADVFGWEIKLGWNASILEVVNVTEGSFLKTGGDTFITSNVNNTQGSVKVDCTLLGDVPGVSGEGMLVTIQFHVKSIGSCDLSFVSTALVNSFEQSMDHTAVGGSFTATP